MAIYRGEGGSGESVTNTLVSQVAANALLASDKADEAAASAVSASNSADEAAASVLSAEDAVTAAEVAQVAAELAQTNAETAQTNAETAETNAEAAEALAEKWATELEDVVVADSKYSAFHWAQKSQEFAEGASAVTSVDLTPGTGISVSGGPITTSGSITVTNTAPDQTVVLTEGANVTITGAYPSFTIAATDTDTTYTGGTGIDLTGTSFSIDSTVATLSGTQTLTNKTLGGAVLNDGYTEEVFAVTGTTPALSPTNGSIQTWSLTANSTPTAGTWAAGQSMTLLVDDGSARTITWTTLAVVWKSDGGVAPTLNTSGDTVIVLWKVGSTIYGTRVGNA